MRALILLLLSLSNVAFGEDAVVRFSSGGQRVSLLELYTSEGCSSCPPAEKWLGSLQDDERLWQQFVPVAFHVSYWDRLGWRDRFAREEFTRRQYALAATWRSESVYTPCFVRDGREWRERALSDFDARSADELSATLTSDGALMVEFSPRDTSPGPAWQAHVALLACGVRSDVRRGENAGRTLEHAFVALDLHETPLSRQPNGTLRATLARVLAKRDATATRHALAVWVTHPGEFTPIQAAGGWVP